MPIKDRFIIKANNKINYLFKYSNNVLGVLIRGTDYITYRPFGNPMEPKPEEVFEDIIEMDNKKNYDFFLTTEDDLIREKFIKKFRKKLKYIISNKLILIKKSF